ncbi:ABC transporter permease subunit [Sinorhizobium medicae]|uniref:Binding-protein-dependent transport systems inner membrane component n=2 Tax=Sinorhizobium medicae TaxID=110321 RepID=A0A508X1F6_9HYPH|nr:binding-protein-dependent transport systems inner membrane component [Sinorhizobium medicae WSM419]MDX0406197.1 ABC transporter permease subunit [Sinorhizobium medicae]MDX0412965.1 ABC transporter permease subunit [Sinorhizobium medicae]MDX0417936.1 ABC transporter permease subunit [Sinorhizobium medicae]MDX0422351.1 ABC transporter permease subunit [Sinorhizobium medicae]
MSIALLRMEDLHFTTKTLRQRYARSGTGLHHPLLTGWAGLASIVVLMPILSIAWLAISGGSADWPHLIENVVPRATGRTLLLVLFTCTASAIIGILAAWLVATYEFPLRRILSAALVLPLAIPAYLSAYAFGELLTFAGPVQGLVRSLFGFQTSRDYWFPDVRSLGGAVLVLSSVLYPYVYLACRSMFLMQGRAAADVARTLGAGPVRVFFRVQLPMARPAIMIGLTLVAMETLNDIGAVEFLGVQTLTFSIFNTWLNRGSLAGAAQIACVMLVFVIALMMIERAARRRQRFASQKTTAAIHDVARLKLSGWKKWAATAACFVPILSGFAVPFLVLGDYAMRRLDQFLAPRLLSALANSVLVSGLTALATVLLGFVLAYAARSGRSRITDIAARLASFGYGVPGTVLAIGVLFPIAALDNAIDAQMRAFFGISTGLLMTGTGFAIVYACTVRFLTMAEGTLEAGFQKLSPHLDMAARALGRTSGQTLRSVLLPMMRPAVLTAALLVFIETMKELSATIMLRPFNFNTLATLVYEDASRARVEDASVAAMIIVIAGMVPVILVSRSLERRT